LAPRGKFLCYNSQSEIYHEGKNGFEEAYLVKYSNLGALNFDSITMRWQEKDIYAIAKSMLQYSRMACGRNHVEVGGKDSNGEDSNVESHFVHLDTCTTLRYISFITMA